MMASIKESRPPSTVHKQLNAPARRIVRSSVNTLSLTDDSLTQSASSIRPVPRPRSSHGSPVASRVIKAHEDSLLRSQASSEFENFVKDTGLATLSSTSAALTPRTPPRRIGKKVEFKDGVHKVSYSPESHSDQTKGLSFDNSVNQNPCSPSNRRRQVTKQTQLKHGHRPQLPSTADFQTFSSFNDIQEFDTFSKNVKSDGNTPGRGATKSVNLKSGISPTKRDSFSNQGVQFGDDDDSVSGPVIPRVPERRKIKVSKQVEVKDGGARAVSYADEGHDTGLSGLHDASDMVQNLLQVPVPAERKKRAVSKSVDITGGQASRHDDFEEVTLSSFVATPRDEDNTITDTPRSVYVPSKAIEIKGGRKTLTATGELQQVSAEQTLQALKDDEDAGQEVVELKSSSPVRPSRKVDLNRSLQKSSGENRISAEYGTLSRTLDVDQSETIVDEYTTAVVDKSRDKSVTSWVEYKEGKRHVRHSDEMENFSLGATMEYTPAKRSESPKRTRSEVHKQVDYSTGKKQIRYADEFPNTISYTDDFEGSLDGSWAVKVPSSPRQYHKQVALKDGKQHRQSGDFGHKLTESIASSIEYSQSFEEVTVEDLESYSEHFDSASQNSKLIEKSRSMTSIPYSMASVTEGSISTQTPITSLHSSIQTSIHTSIPTSIHTSQAKDKDRSAVDISKTSQLYSESFESTSFVPSHTYSDAWESDISVSSIRIPSSYRKKLGIHSLEHSASEDDLSYTMTFTQSTAREGQRSASSESLAERRAVAAAMDSFIHSKMRLLKASRNQRKPRVKQAPEAQEEALEGTEKKEMKKFLKKRIAVLKEKNSKEAEKADDTKSCAPSASLQLRGLSEKENVEKHGISSLMIARLKAENTLANLERAAKIKIHQPHKCKHCKKKQEELAAAEFMWHKKALVSEKLVREKLEMQCLQLQDPCWLYAEALRGLPRVTDDADDVYYKLMRPLFDTYAGKYTETLAPNSQTQGNMITHVRKQTTIPS